MNKGKFASLILLGAFSAGVASSSAVSAQGDSNLASTVDISIGSHDESAVAFDETNIDAETTTDEETQDVSPDDNSDAGINAENINDNPENKTDLPENFDKENKEDTDYIFVGDEKQNVKKGNGVETVKGLTVAGVSASAIGGATFGISKLVESSGYEKKDEPSPEINPESDKPTDPKKKEKELDKKDEPSPETNPEPDKPTGSEEEEKEPEKNPSEKPKEEEKGGFVEWYKNNLGVSIPLTIISLIIARMIYFELWQQIVMYKKNADGIYLEFALEEKDDNSEAVNDNDRNIKPFFGLWKSFTKIGRFAGYYSGNIHDDEVPKWIIKWTITYRGLNRLKVNFVAAATLAKYDWKYSSG